MLRSVVANLWTNAAIEQVEPPVIIAASNNQPSCHKYVWKVLGKVNEEGIEQSLAGRWLPEIKQLWSLLL